MARAARGRATSSSTSRPSGSPSPAFRRLLARLRGPAGRDRRGALHQRSGATTSGREYLQLGELLAELRPPRVLACTATATPVVRDEILARLGLGADTPQILRGFARPNLALRARRGRRPGGERASAASTTQLARGARPRRGRGAGAAIVYATTRKRRRGGGGPARRRRLAERRPTTRASSATSAGARSARFSERRARRGRRDQRVRDGHRPARRARGRPPRRRRARSRRTTRRSGARGATAQPASGSCSARRSDMPLRRRLLERQPTTGAPPGAASSTSGSCSSS